MKKQLEDIFLARTVLPKKTTLTPPLGLHPITVLPSAGELFDRRERFVLYSLVDGVKLYYYKDLERTNHSELNPTKMTKYSEWAINNLSRRLTKSKKFRGITFFKEEILGLKP